MKKIIHLILYSCTFIYVGNAQTTFQRTIGGTNDDLGNAVRQTSDGGYLVAGETRSYGAGDRDVYLVKTDSFGNTVFSKTYGGKSEDYALTLAYSRNGHFIIGAHTGSFGQGGHDHYLLEIDSLGDTLFTKLYGGAGPDGIYSLNQDIAGDYVIGGHTSSFGAGAHDFYLIKTNVKGDTLWTKTYGGGRSDNFRSVVSLEFSGINYVMVGETSSFGAGAVDILMIKTNGFNGDTVWSKTFGGNANDFAYGIYETADVGLILVGHSNSFGAGGMDVYVIKTDFWGKIQWAKTYGGKGDEFGYAIQQTSDNGYIIVGSSNSFGAGSNDVYLIKTNASGDTLWTKTYGGLSDEAGYAVQETSDGGYVITGNTNSFGTGKKDIYLIKTDARGNSGSCHEYSTNTVINNVTTMETIPVLSLSSGTISSSSPTIINNAISSNSSSCDTATGLGSLLDDDYLAQVIPNPTSGSFSIRLNENYKRIYYSIFNLNGIQLEQKEVNSASSLDFDLSNYTPGIYFIYLVEKTSGKRFGFKVIKE
jgi:Secretion system C-terminal sorting domain